MGVTQVDMRAVSLQHMNSFPLPRPQTLIDFLLHTFLLLVCCNHDHGLS